MEDINTYSQFYRKLFSRGKTHNTTWLSLSNYAFYMLMNMTGFVYVNVSNLNMTRESIFYSNTRSYKHFFMNIFVSAVTFFIGHNVCLQSANGLNGLPNGHYLDKN